MIGISLSALITQFIGVAIILFLLYRFVYRPVSRMMNERSAKIKEGLEAADKAREEAKQSETKSAAELAQARDEARKIVADAQDTAKKLAEQEREKTKQQVEEMLAKANDEIQRRTDSALEDARKELGKIVVLATERVVQKKLVEKDDSKLIDGIIQDAFPTKT